MVHVLDDQQCMGLMMCRWLYYIERHTCHKKRIVGNMAIHEGTLAQGYSLDEALGLYNKPNGGFQAQPPPSLGC